jgi:hypothetical protein
MAMTTVGTLSIDPHFHGPPRSGNGGYVCGLLAVEHARPCEVRLRLPPPLDRPLDIVRSDDGSTALLDGEKVVADARDAELALDVPPPPSLAQARLASERYVGFKAHVFPTCFVCGPDRAVGEGLRIFPGDLEGDYVVSAPWKPDASLAVGNSHAAKKRSGVNNPEDESGASVPTVGIEFMWAALDCPGAFTNEQRNDGRATVLGGLSCTIVEPVRIDTEYVVMGWPIGGEGRKAYAGTAIYSADGALHAFARATWIWIDAAATLTPD